MTLDSTELHSTEEEAINSAVKKAKKLVRRDNEDVIDACVKTADENSLNYLAGVLYDEVTQQLD